MKRLSKIEKRSSGSLKYLFISLLLVTTSTLCAQTGIVKGKVADMQGAEPLIGAFVAVKGTGVRTTTDLDGNYVLPGISPGTYSLEVSYISYKRLVKDSVRVEKGKETTLNFELEASNVTLNEIVVVGQLNRQSENVLLLEQKQAVVATQAVGAREMSRKGIANAEAAVAQVAGVSKQNGVKNVFIRGLSDRYNFTTLNGFPVPSNDPEYKNLSLDFFGSDLIQSVGVNKVFSSKNYGDAGGALIDISSKELVGEKEFGLEVSGGFNSRTYGTDFQKADGVSYWGVATNVQPGRATYKSNFSYGNSLSPLSVNTPFNQSYSFAGGKKYLMGEKRNPLTFYLVGSYSASNAFTTEKIFDTTTKGDVVEDFDGKKSSTVINQLLLGNLNYRFSPKLTLDYNLMLIHDNSQYVGDYRGFSGEFESGQADAYNYQGFMRRQQVNENLLWVNQLSSSLKINEQSSVKAGFSYNYISAIEPDRKVNKLFRKNETQYEVLSGDGANVRNYTDLRENDLNTRLEFNYLLPKKQKEDISSLSIGYEGRFMTDNFQANEYSMVSTGLNAAGTLTDLNLDNLLNQTNYSQGLFKGYGRFSEYQVSKYIHASYLNLNYQFNTSLTLNAGLRAEQVDVQINYDVQGGYNGEGAQNLTPSYLLPSINVRYTLNELNSLRLGLSKSYTLPQSKEISPYQYLGLSFSCQGNQNLKPSDNYNADLKWDYYLSPSELLSFTAFSKYIVNPIARTYESNGAGYFTYNNISPHAIVAGIETEIRKNLYQFGTSGSSKSNKLSSGLNASYIYTQMQVNIPGSAVKNSQMEGAAPFILNADLTHDYSFGKMSFLNALVFSYVSDKIYTIGLGGFRDVIEKAAPSLSWVSSCKLRNGLTLKLKAKNILDPDFTLMRASSLNGENKVLNSYKKGIDLSLGISYSFN